MDKPALFAWIQHRDGRYELAGGQVLMLTGGTVNHGLIAGNLFETLRAQLERRKWAVLTEFGVDVGLRTIRYADVVVVDRQAVKPKDLSAKSPALIAEVLSPSTEKLDLGDKVAEYLQLPGLAGYLALDQDEAKAWVYARDSAQFPAPQVISGEAAIIGVPQLGIELPLAEIYAGINFG
jgi:Uma2 family endonuclease